MTSTRLSILLATLLVGCTPTSTPTSSIDRLVTRLSTDKSFGSEEDTTISLPATVRHEVVVERAIAEYHKAKDILHKVLNVRNNLNINGRFYTAVLVGTNTGQEIVLVRYDEHAAGWWWKVYPVSERKP
jgi:hypothetical protein